MDEMKIRNNFYKKVEKELFKYKEYLMTLKPEQIINHSHQLCIKEELCYMLHPNGEDFSIEDIKILNKLNKPLDKIYQDWNDCEWGLNEPLRESVDETIERLEELYSKKRKDKVR